MALTRKMLSAMGIEEDKQDEIINAHTETVNALKEERDSFKADASKVAAMQKELDEFKEATKNGDKSPYKVKYDAKVEELQNLQKEFDDYKAEITAKEVAEQKKTAYKNLLKETGVSEKRIDAIVKITDFDSINLDKDGNLKDKDSLAEGIKSEWSDFIGVISEQGAKTPNPPENKGGKTMTREEIYKKDEHGRYVLSTAERQKALIESMKER